MSEYQYQVVVILVTGALVAAACALLGTFLVLRRMALVGDAISHAILPGLAIGFVLTQSRAPWVMLIGAAAAGLVTVWLVELLFRSRRVSEDTAIALVFPALFALGVLLMDRFAHYVDLDPKCVIQGNIELAADDLLVIGGHSLGPKPLWVLSLATVLNLVFVVLFYKELKLCTFDPGLAESLGFSPARMHYLLMAAVSITTVAAFEAVGAILVVAFLIVPPAAAYLLTNRLWFMLVLAVAIGVLSAVSGYVLAHEAVLDSSIAGGMATMAGVWFVLIWIAAPRYGLLATLRRRLWLRRRFAADLLLLHFRDAEPSGAAADLLAKRLRWSPRYGRSVLRDLETRGLIARADGRIALTDEGVQAAQVLERNYR